MATVYEWVVETVDSDGDIIDSNFNEKLSELDPDDLSHLALVRNQGNEPEGLTDRLWAYVTNGILPEVFSDSSGTPTTYKVPKRFVKELEHFQVIK